MHKLWNSFQTKKYQTNQYQLNNDFIVYFFWIVPLSEVSSFVLKHVIDLFYNGQIMVGAEVKPHIMKALNFLKVANCVIQIPGQEKAPETPKNGKHHFL